MRRSSSRSGSQATFKKLVEHQRNNSRDINDMRRKFANEMTKLVKNQNADLSSFKSNSPTMSKKGYDNKTGNGR